ncbi:hypothetical protein [Labrenzia sp. CE80]|uniref:hypothetical protein n=1 Tax=Labrenzia sp. CE80 TaxID=1788986 RepID=UPI00129A0B2B|nr:hypothetical protein [Labrenzia sp. CE80]
MLKFLKSFILAIAVLSLTAYQTAAATGEVSVKLRGIEVIKQANKKGSKKTEDVFLFVTPSGVDGTVYNPVKMPAGDQSWEKVKTGTFYRINTVVWIGKPKDLRFHIDVRKINRAKKGATKWLLISAGALAGAGITVLTAGAGAVAIAGGFLAGSAAALGADEIVEKSQKEMSKYSWSLGQTNARFELTRAAGYFGNPTSERGGLGYHIHTDHKAHGGHYRLYWFFDNY